MEFDLERFGAHLDKLEDELRGKPSLRHIIDADLEHNLSALRLMGILPKESAPVATVPGATVKTSRHGGTRQGAGRKKMYRTHAEKIRQYRKRKRSVSVYTKSSSQVANFIDVKEG
jgi:hypothetical protein